MGGQLKELVRVYFGTAWETIKNVIPGIGGIIVDHDSREYFIDDSIRDLIGVEAESDFDTVSERIQEIRRNDFNGFTISAVKAKVGISAFVVYAAAANRDNVALQTMKALPGTQKIAAAVRREFLEEDSETYRADMQLLDDLLYNNMITYYYQPIVSAHTGEIVGYEALMRSDRSIGYSPFEILELAEKYDRLYEIEKLTFERGLEFISRNQILFVNRKLYLNSIPAHLLTDEDWDALMEEYAQFMPKVVVEMTEQTEVTEANLEKIKNRIKKVNSQMAIDDFGTGYSNTSNLLRYNPMVVKIDRSLISGIDTNQKMQKIVTSIIDFLHNSGYVALAEGVETSEELSYLIEAGADRIQGYYIARPSETAPFEINPGTKNEIVKLNQNISSEILRVYHPKENEVVNVSALVEQKYTLILIDTENVTIVGDKTAEPAALVIGIKENTRSVVKIKNIKLVAAGSEPTFKLSDGCSVVLECEGDNSFERSGILVPENSSIELVGEGNLMIRSAMKDCYAIGNDSKHSHGAIKINMLGKLEIHTNGDHFIGIGAGYQVKNQGISINSGLVNISATGSSGIGIGCVSEKTDIVISNCDLNVSINSASFIQLGNEKGTVNLNISNVYYRGEGNGISQIGLGVMKEGLGNIQIKNSLIDIIMKGERLGCIGTSAGDLKTDIINTKLMLSGEGANVTGVGDMDGFGEYNLTDTEICCNFSSANLCEIGSRNGFVNMENCKKI